MKAKFLTLVLFTGIATLMISSCSFLRGKGSVTTDSNSICSNYSQTAQSQLEVGLIREMTDIYQDNLNEGDVKAISFDFETLKTFLYHIEMEAAKINIPSKDLGLRIYYASYPDKNTWRPDFNRDLSVFLGNPITEQYELKHTLIIIPTKKELKGTNTQYTDFDPFDANTQNGIPIYYTNPTLDRYNANRTITALPLYGAQNHGQMYPPYPESGMTFN